MGDLLSTLTLLAALGCGVGSGVFFAFSSFVMKALGRLPVPQAIVTMQEINAAALTPSFMALLFGTALACGVLILSSFFVWGESYALYLLIGGASYMGFVILPTAVYHVPRNEALANVDPQGVDAEGRWSRYLSGWTAWNHLRSAGAVAASAALAIALQTG